MKQTCAGFPGVLKAVIFDLDGTLVDTADEFIPVVQRLRAEHGLDAMNPERIRASVSNGARALVSLGLDINEDAPEFESKRLRLLMSSGQTTLPGGGCISRRANSGSV